MAFLSGIRVASIGPGTMRKPPMPKKPAARPTTKPMGMRRGSRLAALARVRRTSGASAVPRGRNMERPTPIISRPASNRPLPTKAESSAKAGAPAAIRLWAFVERLLLSVLAIEAVEGGEQFIAAGVCDAVPERLAVAAIGDEAFVAHLCQML